MTTVEREAIRGRRRPKDYVSLFPRKGLTKNTTSSKPPKRRDGGPGDEKMNKDLERQEEMRVSNTRSSAQWTL